MRKKIIGLLTGIFSLLFASICKAQTTPRVEMADGMRSNGKIYVVVAVLVTILIGIVLYLVRLDRRIKKLEDDIYSQDLDTTSQFINNK